MTVTLGPFFFSSAVEGPGNSRKKTEPKIRATAKRTFMLRWERRSIHREKQTGPRQPRAGRRWGQDGVGTGAAIERDRGGDRGSFRTPERRLASFPPCGSATDSRSFWGAEPGSLMGRAETRARGGLPRYCRLIGSPAPEMPTHRKELAKAVFPKERRD